MARLDLVVAEQADEAMVRLRINAWKPILNALAIHNGDRIQAAS